MRDNLTPLQERMARAILGDEAVDRADMSGPSHLTPAERILYNDDYTSSTRVYDPNCYICRDPDFARMGLPLCRECPRCREKSAGTELGHVAADDTSCTVCGYDEQESYFRRLEGQKHDSYTEN